MSITILLTASLLVKAVTGAFQPVATPFELRDIKLLASPWETAREADAKYLLTVEPDRLLHSFREHAGLKAKGAIYEGWENSGLAGHSLGHYLTACAQQYATSGDVRYKQKVDYIVQELAECQEHRKDGYVGAIPDGDKLWSEIKKGQIRSAGFDLNGFWSPWYTCHKVFAGLIDAYKLTKNKEALVVAEKFGDWAIGVTKDLTDDQWQKMLGCEYGGMNDSLAELYAITGEQKYLDLSRKFYDNAVLKPLAEGRDELANRHSNTQIPKLIGLARLYELTGDTGDRKSAEFFWDRVVNHRTYAIGGNSDHEYLGAADHLSDQLSTNTCETCNTYNMLKLTRHLFSWDPKPEYADFMERAHLNDILASQNPATGMMCYFVPLVSGAHRNYSTPFDDWTCCHGTGMENHTKHADSAYFHTGGARLYITQYMPTELNWHDAGLKIVQTTNFPADGKVALTITSGKTHTFELMVRHPGWAGAFDIKVNGEVVTRSEKPSSFTAIQRTWKKGDKVEFDLPLTLHTEAMPDNANRVAVLYGPTVLAADLGDANGPDPRIPVLVTNDRPVGEWASPVEGQSLTFKVQAAGRPESLTLRPFYQISNNRYAVYFDKFTEAQWEEDEAAYRAEEARIKDLIARTVDYMRVGEMQPERDHSLKESRTDVRDANGRGFRMPLPNGWMEFQLKVKPDVPIDLVLTYWQNQRSFRDFTITVDGQKIASESKLDAHNNVFHDTTYSLPGDLTKGKSVVTIRIEASASKVGPAVAGARTVTQSHP